MSAVLATLSGSYPPLEGRSPTCYSAVRHYLGSEDRRPSDLHVLGTPPAFILSQDQTLHRNCQEPFSLTGQMASPDDLSTDRLAPHHSSIVNVPRAPARCDHRHSSAEGHHINPLGRLSRPVPAHPRIRETRSRVDRASRAALMCRSGDTLHCTPRQPCLGRVAGPCAATSDAVQDSDQDRRNVLIDRRTSRFMLEWAQFEQDATASSGEGGPGM